MKLSDIVIPPDRFRPAENVKSLKDSFERLGQLQPIVIEDETHVLVAGFRRYTAAKELGWAEMEVLTKSQLTERKRREMELEENIQRQQMGWLEVEKARVEIHRLRTAEDPNWTQRSTAAMLGESTGIMSESLTIVKASEIFPEIAKAESRKQAVNWARSLIKMATRRLDVKENPIDFGAIEKCIWLGDSVERIKEIPDESFRIILTDPPFGIDYDKRKEGTDGSLSSYKDDEESYERLLSMAPDMYRVLQPEGWLTWFLGVSWYERCKEVFRAAGFTVDEIPVIWDRSEGKAFTTKPDRYYGRAYDIALHCFKGNPNIVKKNKPNIIRIKPIANSERDLLVERPIELYEEILDRLTIPGEPVLDLFVGSGSVLAAAAKRHQPFFGIELDPNRRAVAIKKVAAWMPK